MTCATAINCALRVRYNPASAAKFKTRNKAEMTGFWRVIIKTDDTAQIEAKSIKSTTSNIIFPSLEDG
jgi:hypothetical protein